MNDPTEHDQSKLLDDVIVTVDGEYRKKLLDNQRMRMRSGVKREGTHVSDLITCVRKSWAERWSDYVQTPSDKTILTWMRGLSHEDLTSEIMNSVRVWYCFSCDEVYSDRTKEDDTCDTCDESLMVGTMDWITMEGDELDYSPVEMKSTLKTARKGLIDMAWYADQVKTYMAMHKKDKGRIGVFHVLGDYRRDDPDVRSDGPDAQFIVYRLNWKDGSGRDEWLSIFLRRKNKLENPNQMPALDEDSPGRHPYICSFCDVGEKLLDGSECAKWPYRRLKSGQYVLKGSNKQDVTIDEMMAELKEMSKEETS